MELTTLCDRALHYLSDKKAERYELPRLSFLRRDSVSDIESAMYEPVLCLILQGRKETSIGDQVVKLAPGDALVVSHDLPVLSRITQASAQEPYLALILALDIGLLRSLFDLLPDARASDPTMPDPPVRSLSAGPADPVWLVPLMRYADMIDMPLDARVLGPSVLREIHYRILLSPIGGMLRSVIVSDSHASRVAKAIQMLRAGFRAPLGVPELAREAGMGVSSFHEHFKAITGTTPLQYQKDLRLNEARGLLVDRVHSVSAAAYSVGYESPTHFSRDYRRKFGLPPSRECAAQRR